MSGEDYAIRVQNLEKVFKVYASPKQMLKELILGGTRHKEFHALKDISFEVKRGEIVGVMGRNGAGKSTLLRILAGTLNATSGIVDIPGRVSAILELGTGFNLEHTGRENIVSGGLVLGMSRDEITAKMDGIIAFAELEDFIDQPFRTYSSGMQSRLTFATAISASPDVLIVDEALAVGDARFQAKCYRHIESFREQGGTIFFVSHAENAIAQLCDTALLLEKGRVLLQGSPRDVGRHYNALLWGAAPQSKAEKSFGETFEKNERRNGTREYAEITGFDLLTQQGKSTRRLVSGELYTIAMRVKIKKDMQSWGFGCNIKDVHGVRLFGADSRGSHPMPSPVKSGQEIVCKTQIHCSLTNGVYFVSGGLSNHIAAFSRQDYVDEALCIEIEMNNRLHTPSVVDLKHLFTVEVGV